MPMSNQTKVITVSEITTKVFDSGTQYKVKSTSGMTFKFYDKKKDGNNTVAFSQYNDMGIRPGSTVEVWYKEEEKEYEGKPYTDRLIASFKEATPQTTTPTPIAPQKAKSGVLEHSYEPEGVDWDEIAVGKCQTNFLAAYIQSGKSFSEAKLQVTQARQLAEMVVYGTQKTATEENIKVEDIPF